MLIDWITSLCRAILREIPAIYCELGGGVCLEVFMINMVRSSPSSSITITQYHTILQSNLQIPVQSSSTSLSALPPGPRSTLSLLEKISARVDSIWERILLQYFLS